MIKFVNKLKNENLAMNEVAVTNGNGNIQQAFKINIHDGKGLYDTGINNTFWSRLIITAKIFHPLNGVWTIIIRDKANKNLIVYQDHHVIHDKEISFNYKTGLKVNLIIEAIWTQAEDTILSGELYIKY